VRWRHFVVLAVVATGGVSAALATTADAKFGILIFTPGTPRLGHPVTVSIRAADTLPKRCQMRLLAVAPGADMQKALDTFIVGGTGSIDPNGPTVHRLQPNPKLGFLMHPYRASATTWRAVATFPRRGRWRGVVPNWCAEGYASPLPTVRALTVH
jgi:hypothetical protein